MNNKSLWLLPSVFLVSFILCVGACSKTQDIPILSEQQAISIVQVYGVPALWIYGVEGTRLFQCTPTAQWSGVYEGNDRWRIQGTIVGYYHGKDYYYSTTWIYDGESISCIKQNTIK